MNDPEEIRRLLRLKRYEQPPAGYYERFAEEFKERQRAMMLSQSARGLLVERVATWMWSARTWRNAGIGGGAGALIAAGFYFVSEPYESKPEPSKADALVTETETREKNAEVKAADRDQTGSDRR